MKNLASIAACQAAGLKTLLVSGGFTYVTDRLKTRLGLVNATRVKTFALDPRWLSHGSIVQLVADPVGDAQVFESERLQLRPGQRVAWTLETDLARSSISIQ